jgi:L-seryl-tRNA(Ser) seleniumtransferase
MVEDGRFLYTETQRIMDIKELLKNLPSVENVLQDKRIQCHITDVSRMGVTRLVRETITETRERMIGGDFPAPGKADLMETIVVTVTAELEALVSDRLGPVINATGVILHTNLGRAVLGDETCAAINDVAGGYSDLEIDVKTGQRRDRTARASRLIRLITGAEDALVVNNNAAAVLLAVQTLAGEGGVAVSRGELVEIGGSFRLPEILASAAERVIEVGTTNKTHLKDYERAVKEGARLLLKVHTSNYAIVGYTDEVPLSKLVELGRKSDVPVMYDQGSGVVAPLESKGVAGEESIPDLLETGVDLICFSADKVLGGPQGGIIVGRADLISMMRSNHLSRALRVGKLTLAGLESVLRQYWLGRSDSIPALEMIMSSPEEIRLRAEEFARLLGGSAPSDCRVEAVDGESSVGGGSYPIKPLRTTLVEINLPSGRPERLSTCLRGMDPPVLVRVKGDSVFVDLRTVTPTSEETLLKYLQEGIGKAK